MQFWPEVKRGDSYIANFYQKYNSYFCYFSVANFFFGCQSFSQI